MAVRGVSDGGGRQRTTAAIDRARRSGSNGFCITTTRGLVGTAPASWVSASLVATLDHVACVATATARARAALNASLDGVAFVAATRAIARASLQVVLEDTTVAAVAEVTGRTLVAEAGRVAEARSVVARREADLTTELQVSVEQLVLTLHDGREVVIKVLPSKIY